MYFPYFISYMIIGFVISLAVFIWALNHGQFRDQARARFLPLEDDAGQQEIKTSGISRYEVYVLLFLAGAGLLASGATLLFALINA